MGLEQWRAQLRGLVGVAGAHLKTQPDVAVESKALGDRFPCYLRRRLSEIEA